MVRRVGRKGAFSWCACQRFAFRGCFITGFALVFVYCAKLLVRAVSTEIDPEGNHLSSLAATTPSSKVGAVGEVLGNAIGNSAPAAVPSARIEDGLDVPEVPPHLLAIAAAALSTTKNDDSSSVDGQIAPKLHGTSRTHKITSPSPPLDPTSSASTGVKAGRGTEAAPAARPNLLLVMLEDPSSPTTERGNSSPLPKQSQAQHDFSRTPFLDELSQSSLQLTSWASPSSSSLGSGCAPNRAALLTGRYGARNSISRPLHAATWSGLPATESTIALALRPHGYRSVLLGSWHLGHVPPHDPLSHGFDEWLGLPFSSDMGCTDPPMGVSAAGALAMSACPHRSPLILPETRNKARSETHARKKSRNSERSVPTAVRLRRLLAVNEGEVDEDAVVADDIGSDTNTGADADFDNADTGADADIDADNYIEDNSYNDGDESVAFPEVRALASKARAATSNWAAEAATAFAARFSWFLDHKKKEKGDENGEGSARVRPENKARNRQRYGKDMAKGAGDWTTDSSSGIRSPLRIKGVRQRAAAASTVASATPPTAAASSPHGSDQDPHNLPLTYLHNPWVRRGLRDSPLVLPLYHACGKKDAHVRTHTSTGRTSSSNSHFESNGEEGRLRSNRAPHAKAPSAVSTASAAQLNAACVRAVSASQNASRIAAGCTNPHFDASSSLSGASDSSRSQNEEGGIGAGWWSIVEQPARLWRLSDRLVSRAEDVVSEHANANVPLLLVLSLPHLEEPLTPALKFLQQAEAELAAAVLAAKKTSTTTADLLASRHASPFQRAPSAAESGTPSTNMLPRKRYRLRRGVVVDTMAEDSWPPWHNHNGSSSSIGRFSSSSSSSSINRGDVATPWLFSSAERERTNPQALPVQLQRQRLLRGRERRPRGGASSSSTYAKTTTTAAAAARASAAAAAAGGPGRHTGLGQDWDASLLAHKWMALHGAATGKAMVRGAALREGDETIRRVFAALSKANVAQNTFTVIIAPPASPLSHDANVRIGAQPLPTVLLHWPQLLGAQPFVKHPSVARADAIIANGQERRSTNSSGFSGISGGGNIGDDIAPLPANHRGVGSGAHAALVAAARRQAAAFALRPLLVHAGTLRGSNRRSSRSSSSSSSSRGVVSDAPTSSLDLFPTFLAAAAAATSHSAETADDAAPTPPSKNMGSRTGKVKKAEIASGLASKRLALIRDGMNLLPLLHAAARYRTRHATAYLADSNARSTNAASSAHNAKFSDATADSSTEGRASHDVLSASVAAEEGAVINISLPSFASKGSLAADPGSWEETDEAAAWARGLFSRALLYEAPRPVGAKLMPDGGVNPNFVAMKIGRYKITHLDRLWRQRAILRNPGDSTGFAGGGKGPSPVFDLDSDPRERQPLGDDVAVSLLRAAEDDGSVEPWMVAALLEEEKTDRARRNGSNAYEEGHNSSSTPRTGSGGKSRETLSALSSALLRPSWVVATVAELRLVALHVLQANQASVLNAPRSIQPPGAPPPPAAYAPMNGNDDDDEASFALPCALSPSLHRHTMCETCPCTHLPRKKHGKRPLGRSCPAEVMPFTLA